MRKIWGMSLLLLPVAALLFASCVTTVNEDRTDQWRNTRETILGASVVPAVSPAEMVKRLGKGINIGNTLDAPNEGEWAAPAQEYYFDDYKAAGFNSVRIPVTWGAHLGTSAPYPINSEFIRRVEQLVDWGLNRGLLIVLNSQHDNWICEDYVNNIARFEAMWSQIAAYFANKSENLVFEIKNEPAGNITADQITDMNSRILRIIRQTNPTRNVIVGARFWNDWKYMINELVIPDDPYVIANFHYYDPYNFTGNLIGTWGSDADKASMANTFNQVKAWANQKNASVYVGEFGASIGSDAASRAAWYEFCCNQLREKGFAYAAWEDAGNFAFYKRSNRTFEPNILASIIGPVVHDKETVIPGTIEAEDYNAMFGVQTESCGEGSLNVGYVELNDWMEYKISVPEAALYEIQYRAASIMSTGKIGFFIDGAFRSDTAIPNTGSWQTYTTVKTQTTIAAGNQTLRLKATSPGWNLNYIRIVKAAASSSSSSSSTPYQGELKVQAFNGSTAVSGNQIYPRLNLVNTGNAAVPLSSVKIRYYYTADGQQTQQFWCDWSPIGNANVSGSFVKITKPNADTYLEIGFLSTAGILNPGQALDVQVRVAKSDWSNFDQSNDYSFNPTATSYGDNMKITAYIDGAKVWGIEP